MRKEFNYFMPTKIVFGNGYIDKVEEYIKKYGIKIMTAKEFSLELLRLKFEKKNS